MDIHRKLVTRAFKPPRRGEGAPILSLTPWARAFLRDNRRALKNFLLARGKLHSEKSGKVVSGSVEVELLVGRPGNVYSHLYKVTAGGRTFFVKEQRKGRQGKYFMKDLDVAEAQIRALERAVRVLQRVKGVEVANYHLAWTHGEDSFLVTDFYDGKMLKEMSLGELQAINPTLSEVTKILANNDFLDADKIENFMWDPQRKKLTVLDLRYKNREVKISEK